MVLVRVKDHEPLESALRRFKRACEKAGILYRLRQLEFYEKPTSKRKRKHAAAIKRNQKRILKENEVFARATTKPKSKTKTKSY